MASRTIPQSSAVRHSGPSLSRLHERAIAPCLLTLPYVGLSPATPQNAPGMRIEPHVSEPIAKGARPAATAAPDPDDEPPAHRLESQGFSPGPVSDALGVS